MNFHTEFEDNLAKDFKDMMKKSNIASISRKKKTAKDRKQYSLAMVIITEERNTKQVNNGDFSYLLSCPTPDSTRGFYLG